MPVAAGDEKPIAARGERREDDVAAEAQNARLAHRSEVLAEDVRGLPSGAELCSLQREPAADLRMGRDIREREADERANMGIPRLRARVASLDKGEHGDGRDHSQGDKARADDREQATMLTVRAELLAPELVLGLPREDWRA